MAQAAASAGTSKECAIELFDVVRMRVPKVHVFWPCMSTNEPGPALNGKPGGLVVVVLAYVSIRSALELRAAVQQQSWLASGVNPDALKSWEILKRDQQLGDAAGLTPAAKKRLRETFALQLRGSLAAFTNLAVDLRGDDHEKLVVACGNVDRIATNWREALQKVDAEFWNRMRFLDFSEIVFTGTNYSESIPKSKFKEWGHSYETYVSNTIAMYQGQLFAAGGNALNPTMQKTMRRTSRRRSTADSRVFTSLSKLDWKAKMKTRWFSICAK